MVRDMRHKTNVHGANAAMPPWGAVFEFEQYTHMIRRADSKSTPLCTLKAQGRDQQKTDT